MNMGAAVTTTYFVGSYYEVVQTETGTQVNKYYYAGSQRIAMRQNGTLNFILGDHLGSTSLVTDANGVVISETRYKAWGEARYASGNSPAKYTFTGQYTYTSDFGLMFYNARWVDVSLGRFAQADIVSPNSIQGLDRFAYVGNNPVRYIDPSGHLSCVGANWDDGPQCFTTKYLWTWGIKSTGSSEYDNVLALSAARDGVKLAKLGKDLNFAGVDELQGDPQSVFRKTHGNITVVFGADIAGCETNQSTITCGSIERPMTTFLHEFGHVLENYLKSTYSTRPASDLDAYEDSEGHEIDQKNGIWSRTTEGFMCPDFRCLEHPPSLGYYIDNVFTTDQTNGAAKIEQWGDLYMNWILDGTGDPDHGFTSDSPGNARRHYMIQQFYWIFTGEHLP